MAVKKLIITAYDVNTTEATTRSIKPFADIVKALSNSKTINERFMRLSELDENKEGDFIASFTSSKKYIFGLILRMKEGEMAHILKDQLDHPMITLEEIAKETEANVAGAMKEYSYFLLNNTHLIYTQGLLSLKSFQTYVNWLLRKEDEDGLGYVFNPVVRETNEVSFSGIKTIEISDSAFSGDSALSSISKSFDILKNGILKTLLANSRDLEEIEAENIISARIQLKIKSMGGKKDSEKKKALTAIIKSADNDDVTITAKDGTKIKGASFVVKKTLTLETTKNGFPIESHMENEMHDFADVKRTFCTVWCDRDNESRQPWEICERWEER